MKRKIIKIDEDKCNGCGVCVPDCPEGALQIIDGKARLVGDLLCDGLGACIGRCPLGAIEVEEREAEPYDEHRAIENVIPAGPAVIKAHLAHLRDHGQNEYLAIAMKVLKEKNISVDFQPPAAGGATSAGCNSGGCPGSRAVSLKPETGLSATGTARTSSELRNWPVQLKLLNPEAPYLKNSNLLIAADCAAFAHPDFHGRFIKGRIVVMLCPKLDSDIEEYVEKLAHIFKTQNIASVTIVKMEVPCCGGVEAITRRAIEKSGSSVFVKEYTLSIQGNII